MYKIINQNKTNQRTSLLISLFETNYLKAEELFPRKLNTHFFSFSLPEGNLHNNVSIKRISFSNHTDLLIIKQSQFKTLGLKNIEIEVEKKKYEAIIELKPLHDSDNKIMKK